MRYLESNQKLFGGVTLPGHPDPENVRRLDVLPLPMIRRMQNMGLGFNREKSWDLSDKLETRMVDLRKQISSYVPPEHLEQFAAAELTRNCGRCKGTGSWAGAVCGACDGQGKVVADDIGLNVDSSEQIATLLFDVLGVGLGKRLKKTKAGDRLSTGKKQMEALKRDHPIIPLILAYREASKLRSTYTTKLPQMAVLHNGGLCKVCGRQHLEPHYRIHGELATTRTDTGRLAHRNPNLANIPARSELGRAVRGCFEAQPGYQLLSADYSQIELRLMGHCSREPNMIRIFREGGDIHLDTAMRAFGITDPKKVDKLLHRAPCKNVNFGIGYGLGAPGLLDLMALTYATAGLAIPDWLDLEWCEDFIQKWFGLYPMTAEYFALQHYRARRYRMVWTLAGRVRRVPEVASCLSRVHEAGLRQGGNMPIQGTAADLNKVGMGITDHSLEMLREAGVDVEALMSIHDELIVEVEDKWAEVVQPVVETSMAQCMNVWDAGECGGKVGRLGESLSRVPIKTDGHLMREWVKD